MVRRKKIETDSSIKTGNDELSMVTEIETAPENLSADELEKEFPIMTLRNMVMFPSVVMPVTAGRRTTLKLVHDAMKDKRHIIQLPHKSCRSRRSRNIRLASCCCYRTRITRIRNAWWKHNCHPSGKQHQGTS